MSEGIQLKILMPEKTVVEETVYRVVLPYEEKTLTVIKGRAPTLLSLEMGIIRVLDENNKVIKEYVVSGGAADIKNDTCTILTEAAADKSELTLETVRALNAEFSNPFLRWLLELFEFEEKFGKTKS